MLSTETFGNTSQRSLREIATEHSTSRVISTRCRDYFRVLAQGKTPLEVQNAMGLDNFGVLEIFYETAASCATRYAQSPTRRIALGDLDRLRLHVFANDLDALPEDWETWTVTLKVKARTGPFSADDTVQVLANLAAGALDEYAEGSTIGQRNATTVVQIDAIRD